MEKAWGCANRCVSTFGSVRCVQPLSIRWGGRKSPRPPSSQWPVKTSSTAAAVPLPRARGRSGGGEPGCHQYSQGGGRATGAPSSAGSVRQGKAFRLRHAGVPVYHVIRISDRKVGNDFRDRIVSGEAKPAEHNGHIWSRSPTCTVSDRASPRHLPPFKHGAGEREPGRSCARANRAGARRHAPRARPQTPSATAEGGGGRGRVSQARAAPGSDNEEPERRGARRRDRFLIRRGRHVPQGSQSGA